MVRRIGMKAQASRLAVCPASSCKPGMRSWSMNARIASGDSSCLSTLARKSLPTGTPKADAKLRIVCSVGLALFCSIRHSCMGDISACLASSRARIPCCSRKVRTTFPTVSESLGPSKAESSASSGEVEALTGSTMCTS